MNGVAGGSLWTTIEAQLERSTVMKWLEKRLHLNKKILLLIFSLSLISFVSVSIGKSFVINLVMFVCPVYHSYKALKTCDPLTMKRNLSYWVVLGSLCILESMCYTIIKYIPMYSSIKVIFLFYCFLPSTNGAEKVLQLLITPLLTPYESTLDYPMDAIASLDPYTQLPPIPNMPNISNLQMPNIQMPNMDSMNVSRQQLQQQLFNYYYKSYGLNDLDAWTQQNTQNINQVNSNVTSSNVTSSNVMNSNVNINTNANINVNANANVSNHENIIKNNADHIDKHVNHLRQRNGHVQHDQNSNINSKINGATNRATNKRNNQTMTATASQNDDKQDIATNSAKEF